MSAHDDGAQKPRQELLRAVPWLNKDLLHLRPKETYKRNFGMAVNCALPAFDLVIVDEGHNLKAGWKLRGATRNVVIGCALGGKEPQRAAADGFHGYGLKARRVLFLSATPIEHDYVQLWNQLDLLGHGHQWARLADTNASDEERRELLRGLLKGIKIRALRHLPASSRTISLFTFRAFQQAGLELLRDERSISCYPGQKRHQGWIGVQTNRVHHSG